MFIKQLLPRLTIHPLPLYESGSAPCLRTHKYKVNRAQEFVIGGYTPGNPLDALIVGYYEGERLLYAAKVRNGFVPQLRRDVGTKFKGLQIDACPFANLPERKRTQWALTKEEMKNCVLAQAGAGSSNRVHRMDTGWSLEAFEVWRVEGR